MEKSSSNIEIVDSQRLLFKYQYAFLNMQRHFTSCIKIFKGFMQIRLYKAFSIWKLKINKPYSHVRNQLNIIKVNIILVCQKLNFLCKKSVHKAFFQIILFSKTKNFYLKASVDYKKIKETNKVELETMKNEVKSLKKTQAHLGKLKNYSEKKLYYCH